MRARTLILIASFAASAARAESPPDLRLEWIGGPTLVRGTTGDTVDLRYRIRNLGGRDAFASVLKTLSSLGAVGEPLRIQPGPAAGRHLDGPLKIVLATGMRELCIEILLQNRTREDPADPTPGDNRACRPVKVEEPKNKERRSQ